MKLLVDNNLPPRLGRGLGALFDGYHQVVHIKDKFGTGSLPDEEWIVALGKEGGWCVLSGDRNIARRRPSRNLFLASKLIGFFPKPAVLSKKPIEGVAARVLVLWPAMVATADSVENGCFELGVSGQKLKSI